MFVTFASLQGFWGFGVLGFWGFGGLGILGILGFGVSHGWCAVVLLFGVKYDALAMWETAENEERNKT